MFDQLNPEVSFDELRDAVGAYYDVYAIEKMGSERKLFSQCSAFRAPLTDQAYVVVVDNGVFRIAAGISDEGEYTQFYEAYLQGIWLSLRLYQIPREKLGDCPDQGWRPSILRERP
ncbi:hypothetical protein AB4Y44_40035 [Paraburkholderia sp. BR10937]|uniref:hypothetical protein n=1 Tax=Paraburkholderia sp. BR10937 TaxID=3236994 RepID=UPI0034D3303D